MKLLIKAFTGSEWDSCDVAIIDIDIPATIKKIKTVRQLKKKDDTIGYVTHWFVVTAEFKTFPDGDDQFSEDEYVKLYNDDMQLDDVETHVESADLYVYEDWVIISAKGKHTSEEFWTESISLDKLLELSKI